MMVIYFFFIFILGTIVYGMEKSPTGVEISKRHSDGLVHDVVQQLVAEQIERHKIMKVFREMKNEFQDVKRELKERNTLIRDTKFLQRKLLQKIKGLKEEVTGASMSEVKNAIKGYDKRVKTLTKRLQKNIQRHDESIKLKIDDTKNTVSKIQRSLIDLQNKTGRDKEEIAFTAKLNTHITTSSAITFQAVITNIGGGYNSSDGIFYCPKAGLYLFSVSLMTYFKYYVDGKIMKNNKEIFWIHENIKINHYPSASVTALMKLAVGDKVWVKGSGLKYYKNANSFAGFYIN